MIELSAPTMEREAYADQAVIAFTEALYAMILDQAKNMSPISDLLEVVGLTERLQGREWIERGRAPKLWLLMARAGLGLVETTPETEATIQHSVLQICNSLKSWLFTIPPDSPYPTPFAFADTEIGELWHAAMIWAIGRDQLVTVVEAANMLGISRQAVSQRMFARKLTVLVDPWAPQHQGRNLLLRSEIAEALHMDP